MLPHGGGSCPSCVCSADIQNLKSDVIGDSADERRVKRVVLYIIDDGRVVGISASRTNGFIALGVGGKVPLPNISGSLFPVMFMYSPETDCLVLTTSGKVAGLVGVPAQAKSFGFVAQ